MVRIDAELLFGYEQTIYNKNAELAEAQARIEKLQKALEVMRNAVEFYACVTNWDGYDEDDKTSIESEDWDSNEDFTENVGGKRARQALADVEEILK